tara:strand:+ start:2187 stop:2507 length:321 start_codon:yes stop_codon:yes gene_type:complete
MMNFQKMMKQAQEMQFKLQEVQEKLKDIEVEGEAGGGLVKVTMTCAGKVTHVNIDDSLMESDKETLEDLIAAAVNTANEAKDEKVQDETRSMMVELGLPADTNLPF